MKQAHSCHFHHSCYTSLLLTILSFYIKTNAALWKKKSFLTETVIMAINNMFLLNKPTCNLFLYLDATWMLFKLYILSFYVWVYVEI